MLWELKDTENVLGGFWHMQKSLRPSGIAQMPLSEVWVKMDRRDVNDTVEI